MAATSNRRSGPETRSRTRRHLAEANGAHDSAQENGGNRDQKLDFRLGLYGGCRRALYRCRRCPSADRPHGTGGQLAVPGQRDHYELHQGGRVGTWQDWAAFTGSGAPPAGSEMNLSYSTCWTPEKTGGLIRQGGRGRSFVRVIPLGILYEIPQTLVARDHAGRGARTDRGRAWIATRGGR